MLNDRASMLRNISDLPRHDRWLLVSHSARGLVQSGVRAGMGAVVIDLYGDADTRSAALDYAPVLAHTGTFDPDSLLQAAERLAPADSACALIYGSGFEGDEDLLERLAQGRTLYGNTPNTVRTLKTPPLFFALLDSLDIPYPPICYEQPANLTGWLLKPQGGAGGKGIRPATAADAVPTDYFQRRLEGPALSVLFVANGHRTAIIGFNTLWTTGSEPDTCFLFAGAINRAALTDSQRETVQRYVSRLVQAVSLKGLNSLDFMLENGDIRVLEINPRPSATLSLYDADYPQGLLHLHVAACQGHLPHPVPVPGPVRAFRVVCAPTAFEFPAHFHWPEGYADLPMPGTRIEPGQPVCSVLAEGLDVQAVLTGLAMRERRLLGRLGGLG